MPIGGCLLTRTHFNLCGLHAIFQGLRLVTSCEAAFPSLLQTEVLSPSSGSQALQHSMHSLAIPCTTSRSSLDLDVVHGIARLCGCIPVCSTSRQLKLLS